MWTQEQQDLSLAALDFRSTDSCTAVNLPGLKCSFSSGTYYLTNSHYLWLKSFTLEVLVYLEYYSRRMMLWYLGRLSFIKP